MNTYNQLLQRLLSVSLHGGMKLGLDNCLRLNECLDNPIGKFDSVHVAGSNGKGSVCTKIAKAYELQGLSAGLYTSPHIATWRERVTINGEMISEAEMARLLAKIFDIIDTQDIPATFFEISTLLAFAYFAERNVDVAIVETGLGGRLDATNILLPKLSVITSISLDHTEILGNTIEAIASEKAGIIKPNVPVVIGPRVPKNIIEKVAKENHSPLYCVEGIFPDYLAENNAVAATAIDLLQFSKAIRENALKALPPCRLEAIDNIIMDVAHNPDGLQMLFQAIKNRYPNKQLRCVTGLSRNKDIENCLKILNAYADNIHLVTATNGRGAPPELLTEKLVSLGRNPETITTEHSIQTAVEHARSLAEKNGELIIICGTFFIMHEARTALGISEPADEEDLNERRT